MIEKGSLENGIVTKPEGNGEGVGGGDTQVALFNLNPSAACPNHSTFQYELVESLSGGAPGLQDLCAATSQVLSGNAVDMSQSFPDQIAGYQGMIFEMASPSLAPGPTTPYTEVWCLDPAPTSSDAIEITIRNAGGQRSASFSVGDGSSPLSSASSLQKSNSGTSVVFSSSDLTLRIDLSSTAFLPYKYSGQLTFQNSLPQPGHSLACRLIP